MTVLTNIRLTAAAIAAFSCLAVQSVRADSIPVTFQVSGIGTTITPPPHVFAIGRGSGLLIPFAVMDWLEYNYLTILNEAQVGTLTGTFSMTFAPGSTLAGKVGERFNYPDAADNVTYDQTLTILRGTGSLYGVSGTIDSIVTLNQNMYLFSVSGAGSVSAPVPTFMALLAAGFMELIWGRKRVRTFQ